MKRLAAAAAVTAALLMSLAATVSAKTDGGGRIVAAPGIQWGVSDDGGKFDESPASWFSDLKSLNLTQDRWTLNMDQNNPTAITELPFLVRAAPAAQAQGVKVILALYASTTKSGGTVTHSSSQSDPTAFCTWAALVANTVKGWGIHDFIIWNEPNTALYWSPQDANAPALYEALLARCYDMIHAADPAANVIGMGLSPRSNGSSQTSPKDFLDGVAAAYKASGRTTRIMDQLSIHPYPNPNSPTDSPDVGYANPEFFGIPNLDRVKQWIYDGFNGTGQPTTLNGLTFLIDELGWQTDTTAYGSQYFHPENVAVVSEQTQADYEQKVVQKYFACDPAVTGVDFFLKRDEQTRDGKDQNGNAIGGGWQSGFETYNGTKKISANQVAPLFAQGRAACTAGQVNWQPTGSSAGGSSGGKGGTSGGAATCKKYKTVGKGKSKKKVCVKR